jgi:hypothetical protein
MKSTNLTPPTASQAYIYIRLSSQSQAWGESAGGSAANMQPV